MESGSGISGNAGEVARQALGEGVAVERLTRLGSDARPDPLHIFSKRNQAAENIGNLPPEVRASALIRSGEYDARRLRSQRAVIRDVMLAAVECNTWLTLGELRGLTRYGEA